MKAGRLWDRMKSEKKNEEQKKVERLERQRGRAAARKIERREKSFVERRLEIEARARIRDGKKEAKERRLKAYEVKARILAAKALEYENMIAALKERARRGDAEFWRIVIMIREMAASIPSGNVRERKSKRRKMMNMIKNIERMSNAVRMLYNTWDIEED